MSTVTATACPSRKFDADAPAALAFAGCADHVVVLNGIGEVVEQGAPKDLILSNGVFASLHEAAVVELSLTPDPGH